MPVYLADRARKQAILKHVRGRTLDQAAADTVVRPLLNAEARAADPQKLVTEDLLRIADAARAARAAAPSPSLFSTADVIIVPGFMGSELTDETPRGHGLIWIDPTMARSGTSQLLALRLRPTTDQDAEDGVEIRPRGAVPLIYAGLKYALDFSGYDARIYGFDWRKHVDAAAAPLADQLRARAGRRPRPFHLIAHSQGALVARRALQMVGPELARRLVDTVVLLGPATAGTFSAAFALTGSHEMIDTARRYGLSPLPDLNAVFQSMTGLYQLLPWRDEPVSGTEDDPALRWVREHCGATRPDDRDVPWFRDPAAWKTGIDEVRLEKLGWGRAIDAGFMNDRTTIILGDQPTVGGVRFDGRRLVEDREYRTSGDGTVPDSLARVEGVGRVFKAMGAEHMMLPATWDVIVAVRDVLADRHPRIESFASAEARAVLAAEGTRAMQAADGFSGKASPRELAKAAVPFLDTAAVSPEDFFSPQFRRRPKDASPPSGTSAAGTSPRPGAPAVRQPPAPPRIADVSPPAVRRLQVFSFDPLFATELENLGAEQVTVELPWEFADGDRLQPGPVGEYLEVVDFDASGRCFYPPVDLNHPHLLAQDGLPVSEGDPRFHQQMVYAVAMSTIRHFELALGRPALWAPNLPRDEYGEVRFPPDHRPGDEYVGRLRIYPHAMRARNAYYSPTKKALLFGYFPAEGPDVGRNLPGGLVFSSLSFDIVAHETTHALLDGLHRHFVQPSNPDVLAFHEAFADIVALLQHFSHPEVLVHELARARGDIRRESALGVLAAQFGEASGQRGALRSYLGRVKRGRGGDIDRDKLGRPKWEPILPDASAIRKETESHGRGAILVAAVFRAFLNIYENRVKDLRRIATGGTGVLPAGDLHPDLVSRMATEAAKAAQHLLRMCVRALDYIPPVDVTFGEYLRALITADYDLVRNDDLKYRVSVLAAFRDWGIYPGDVPSLSVDSLLWGPPEWREHAGAGEAGTPLPSGQTALGGLHQFFAKHPLEEWAITDDRRAAYRLMNQHCAEFHDWLADPANLPPELAVEFGLRLDERAPQGIRRDAQGRPVFQVHMLRPCRRIGPDGQELTDVVVEVIQRRLTYFDEVRQTEVDDSDTGPWTERDYRTAAPDFHFYGGATLIIDPRAGVVRYCIRKRIDDDDRLGRERAYRKLSGLFGSYLAPAYQDNPFALVHSHE